MPVSRIAHNTQHGAGESAGGGGAYESCTVFLLVNRLDSFGSEATVNENIPDVPPPCDRN